MLWIISRIKAFSFSCRMLDSEQGDMQGYQSLLGYTNSCLSEKRVSFVTCVCSVTIQKRHNFFTLTHNAAQVVSLQPWHAGPNVTAFHLLWLQHYICESGARRQSQKFNEHMLTHLANCTCTRGACFYLCSWKYRHLKNCLCVCEMLWYSYFLCADKSCTLLGLIVRIQILCYAFVNIYETVSIVFNHFIVHCFRLGFNNTFAKREVFPKMLDIY